MAQEPDSNSEERPQEPGLRDRKKARRRQEILLVAKRLFARDGVDATTMASIAEDADISPPTVFNYFGKKENILSALLFEGAQRERKRHLSLPRKTDLPFAEVMGNLLCECTQNTMKIAGKRVWRYAEAANIRRPNTEFEQMFVRSDLALLNLITTFMTDYDIKLRSGQTPDTALLGQLFYDRWTARYMTYIKDEDMPIESHMRLVRKDVETMVSVLFDEAFAAHSPIKGTLV